MFKLPRIAIAIIISTVCLSVLADPPILTTASAIQKTDASRADVIIIGDTNHELSTIRDAVAQSLPIFKESNPSLDCLFLEVDSRMQPAFDKYERAQHPDYKGTILQANDDERSPLERSGVIKTNAATAFTESLLQAAKNEQIHVFAADIDFSTDLGNKIQSASLMASLGASDIKTQEVIGKLMIDERSRLFSQKIIDSKSRGICHTSMAVMGIGHMTKTSGAVPVVTLQERIKSSGLSIKTLAVISGSCKTDKNPDEQKKLICSDLAGGKSYSALIVDGTSGEDPLFAIIGM